MASPDLARRCRACGLRTRGRALPSGWGVARLARRCRAAWALPLNLQPQKKHNIWKKPPCTWYSGFFHCEKIRGPGRWSAERKISGVGFRWCAVPRLRTWCKNSRKRLFLRFLAPSHLNPKPPIATDRVFDVLDVVLHLPQTLFPSSGGTTSPGLAAPFA